MNIDEKNEIILMRKSHAWDVTEALMRGAASSFREMATQEPGSVSDQQRTWYSGLARGIEIALDMPVDNQPLAEDEN